MTARIQNLDSVVQEYTDHAFVHASLLGVSGILAMVAFLGPLAGA